MLGAGGQLPPLPGLAVPDVGLGGLAPSGIDYLADGLHFEVLGARPAPRVHLHPGTAMQVVDPRREDVDAGDDELQRLPTSIRRQTLRCVGMFLDAQTRAMGMTTAKWMELPVREVAVSSLTPTQSIVDLLPAHEPNATSCADPYIHVLRLGGVLYVQDGHHRLARAQHAHQWTIQARVLDLSVGLTIVAMRGERTIRWKCLDMRELRERSEMFLSEGYTLS